MPKKYRRREIYDLKRKNEFSINRPKIQIYVILKINDQTSNLISTDKIVTRIIMCNQNSILVLKILQEIYILI